MIRRAQHSNRKTLSLKDRVFRLECWALLITFAGLFPNYSKTGFFDWNVGLFWSHLPGFFQIRVLSLPCLCPQFHPKSLHSYQKSPYIRMSTTFHEKRPTLHQKSPKFKRASHSGKEPYIPIERTPWLKEPYIPSKEPNIPIKRTLIWKELYIPSKELTNRKNPTNERALYSIQKALHSYQKNPILERAQHYTKRALHSRKKSPTFLQKRPTFWSKEHIPIKRTLHSKKPYIPSKEPNIWSKGPYIPFKKKNWSQRSPQRDFARIPEIAHARAPRAHHTRRHDRWREHTSGGWCCLHTHM